MAETVRVLLIESSKENRSDFRALLTNSRYAVVGEAACGDDALAKYEEWRPQVTVLHVNAPGHHDRPGEGGIGIIKRVMEADPKARIVIVYDLDTKYLRVNAIKAGALSAVGRPYKREDVLRALAAAEAVRPGEIALQRSDVRLKKPLAVQYKKSSDGFLTGMRTGVTDDISPSGLSIRTQENLAEKTILKLEIEMPGQPKVYARGKVVRCKPVIGIGQNNVGIAFTEIKEDDVGRIKAFILTAVSKGDKAY